MGRLFKFVLICFVIFDTKVSATHRMNNKIHFHDTDTHQMRHWSRYFDANLASARRYARQTMMTSSNMSWPVKRTANIEGDIILGNYKKKIQKNEFKSQVFLFAF